MWRSEWYYIDLPLLPHSARKHGLAEGGGYLKGLVAVCVGLSQLMVRRAKGKEGIKAREREFVAGRRL